MRTIQVVPYNPEWLVLYDEEKQRITNALGKVVEAVHHIGSTSIAGLAAKPIIDIMLEVSSLDALDKRSGGLVDLGYEAKGELGIERRRYFQKGGDDRTHQIHAFQVGDTHVTRHLAFRDYLKAHSKVLEEYEVLKIQVAESCNNDIEAYCDGKNNFIQIHERKAVEWFSKT